MADWSDTYIKYKSKDKEKLLLIKRDIEKFLVTDDYLEKFLNFEENVEVLKKEFPNKKIREEELYIDFPEMKILDIKIENNSLIIVGSGRYSAPYTFFLLLAERYKTDMIFLDANNYQNFSFYVEIKEGKKIKDKFEETFFTEEVLKYIYQNDISTFLYDVDYYIKYEPLNKIKEVLKCSNDKECFEILIENGYQYEIEEDYDVFLKELYKGNVIRNYNKYEAFWEKLTEDAEKTSFPSENLQAILINMLNNISFKDFYYLKDFKYKEIFKSKKLNKDFKSFLEKKVFNFDNLKKWINYQVNFYMINKKINKTYAVKLAINDVVNLLNNFELKLPEKIKEKKIILNRTG